MQCNVTFASHLELHVMSQTACKPTVHKFARTTSQTLLKAYCQPVGDRVRRHKTFFVVCYVMTDQTRTQHLTSNPWACRFCTEM